MGLASPQVVSEYLKASYFALDGLWFILTEKKYSQKEALEIDEEVWKILPKIQAREVKELLHITSGGLKNFLRALKVKLEAEGYEYEAKIKDCSHLDLFIWKCPWYALIRKSHREHIPISDICAAELESWMGQFEEGGKVTFKSLLCAGNSRCHLIFAQPTGGAKQGEVDSPETKDD